MTEPATPDRPYRCRLCHFDTPVDDVELRHVGSSECVCLRCYHRETGSELLMDKQWRKQWRDAAEDAPWNG